MNYYFFFYNEKFELTIISRYTEFKKINKYFVFKQI